MRWTVLLVLLWMISAHEAHATEVSQSPANSTSSRIRSFQDLHNRAALIKALNEFALTDNALAARGGTNSKSIGCYLNGNTRVIFNSGYKDVDAKTKSQWTLDLHNFIAEQGGGWDNYRKYLSETKSGTALQETINDLVQTKDPNDPMDRAHVSYDKQAVFADSWWKKNSQTYKTSIVPPKDWWIHDAILDGNNLWTLFEHHADKGGSDYFSWREAELSTLMQKK